MSSKREGGIHISREWIAAVKTALYLQGKTQKDMAEDLGVSYQYVRGIMCGRYESIRLRERIEKYCGMSSG